ncbi:MAG: exodeoxyribonuclease VII large subunit [Verrucomicrobiales bacterium]|nr:exodeoxyribonuclease VII large subunit [Verrucomicrobiales bacterium]|tara:strand:+ start:3564 stop:4973 length:1410 start_codon:yes stop_codon:yes gene_type:complete
MPRKSKSISQWDFGELFEPEETRKVHSVSEITSLIKQLLTRQIGQVWISGEITNLRTQSSGHIYFSLKDAGSQLNCALFRSQAIAHREYLEDGQKVLISGDVTVYEARGQYQLIVTDVELQGVGALQLKFEKLKQKLQAEGLFDSEPKLPIPMFPERIGLVTSATGAAIQDVIHVLERRHPALEIILASCRVQGDGAGREIARQIAALNHLHEQLPLDLILVTRGGGSIEDLWAFNEEIVARAVHRSQIPIVSAIGHEIDFTISDFVADLRAATPSAAAEQISEGMFSSRQFIATARARLDQLIDQALVDREQQTGEKRHRLSLAHPLKRVNELHQRLDDLRDELNSEAGGRLQTERLRLNHLEQRLRSIRLSQFVDARQQQLQSVARQFRQCASRQVEQQAQMLKELETRLRLLSPQATLDRGYSITTDDKTGKIIQNASKVKKGAELNTRVSRGEFKSTVHRKRLGT